MLHTFRPPPAPTSRPPRPVSADRPNRTRRLLSLSALASLTLPIAAQPPTQPLAQPLEKHKHTPTHPPNHPTPDSFNGQPIPAAQLKSLPVGLYLPVALNHALRAGNTRPGIPIQAYTTQRIPVAPALYIPRGIEVLGTVLSSTAGAGNSTLTLRFNTLRYRGHDLPLHADALAIGNFSNVDDTHIPQTVVTDLTDSSPANWTTRQLGGDILTRQAWYGVLVNTRTQRVGFGDFHGIYADPQAPLNAPAGTTPPIARLPRALGAFSSDASGLYGFDRAATLASGSGDITVTSPGHALLRADDNLLLRVYDPSGPAVIPVKKAAKKPTPATPASDDMTPTASQLSTPAPHNP